METKVWLFVAGSLLTALICACAAPKRVAPEKQPSRSTYHWVQDDQLQLIMKKLGVSSGEHWPTTLPDDSEVSVTAKEHREAFHDAAELAAELGNAAGRIPDTLDGIRLSEADHTAFIGTAQLLGSQARNLKRSAQRHNTEEMQRQLDAIRATCISCHTRFKDISGELPPRV